MEESVFDLSPEQLDRLLSIGTDGADLDEDEKQDEQTNGQGAGYPEGGSSSAKFRSEGTDASLAEVVEQTGGWMGQYKLLSVLGEGGMGIVYLAEQKRPIKRRVALKVIKPGMDSKRVIARFEAERQTLALLDHPNIAHVYDAGTTQSGRPYFVMEYVQGIPISDYCDHHKLTIKDRLDLFLQVCHAVQHAHQKGIIHRDIKPSNILVSAENDRPTPKIIDFGVAKAMTQPLTERTHRTKEGQLLGTPEYMSPEQADMATEDIDTRSDVYSLGVLLYALLTGVLPFDIHSLRDSGIENIRKTIRETDPKTPSTRLTSLGEDAKKVAEQRSTEISSLTKHLKKELEWIPLKAMRKERSERYRSASELADDIENYLSGSPLIAGPPTTIYRLKKLVRRHKSLVASLIAVFAVLTAGIIISSVFALRERRQAQRLVAIVDFLTVDVLGSARQITGRDATAIDLIDAATVKLDAGAFEDQHLTAESLIRFRLGNLIGDLGYPNKAVPHLERVAEIYSEHGLTPPKTGRLGDGGHRHLVMNYLALAYLHSGELEKAKTLFQQIIQEKEKQIHIGMDLYPWVKLRLAEIYQMQARYEDAEHIYLEMMDPQFGKGEDLPPKYMVACMRELAETYRHQGQYEEAEQMYIKVQEMGEWLPSIPLARLYSDMGRYPQAEELLRTEIDWIPHNRPGKDPVSLITAKNDLAMLLTKQGDFDEAGRLFAEVWEVEKEKWSDDHPDILTTINAIGVLRREQQRYGEAESLLRQALEGRQHKLGNNHPACFESMHELALLYKNQARYEEAEKYLREAVEGRRLKLGDKHPHTLESWNNLIDLYEAWNEPEKASEWRAKLSETEAERE